MNEANRKKKTFQSSRTDSRARYVGEKTRPMRRLAPWESCHWRVTAGPADDRFKPLRFRPSTSRPDIAQLKQLYRKDNLATITWSLNRQSGGQLGPRDPLHQSGVSIRRAVHGRISGMRVTGNWHQFVTEGATMVCYLWPWTLSRYAVVIWRAMFSNFLFHCSFLLKANEHFSINMQMLTN